MTQSQPSPAVNVVRGPKGVPICMNDLPDSRTTRWVASRKAIVASAVRGGMLSIEAAAERYRLSMEELEGWIARLPPVAGATIGVKA